MINQITMWQMVVDLCLVTSILIMAFRFVRSSRVQSLIPQAIHIETNLRRVIAEAEAAGRHLHDQLLRREQNIAKHLSECEGREKALSLSIVDGESISKELHLACESARRESKELARIIEEAQSQAPELVETETSPRSRSSRSTKSARASRNDSSSERERTRFSTKKSSRRAAEWLEEDDIDEELETERSRASVQDLQKVYGHAESMLKSGKGLSEVSEVTKIPVEGVKRLAQMIEIEREESSATRKGRSERAAADPRLGALGTTRRPTTTL